MKQPPQFDRPRQSSPPGWRRPPGVAPGTWEYVHQSSIADNYDQFVSQTPLCRLDQEILAQWLPGSGGSNRAVVLDLGCGTGRTAVPLARRGYDVLGIDLSQSMLKILAAKAAGSQQHGSSAGRVYPLRANLVQLGALGDAIADHAVCLFSTLGMIQGRSHRLAMLQHVARAVRPGGILVVHVHNRWSALCESGGPAALVRSWWRSTGDPQHEFGDATYGYRGLSHMFMHRFSRRELTKLLSHSGWTIDEMVAVSIEGDRRLPVGIFREPAIAGGFLVKCRR